MDGEDFVPCLVGKKKSDNLWFSSYPEKCQFFTHERGYGMRQRLKIQETETLFLNHVFFLNNLISEAHHTSAVSRTLVPSKIRAPCLMNPFAQWTGNCHTVQFVTF